MRGKYKRLTDLYVQGTEVVLADGNVLWMQVLNPYERDEALHDAQVARARLVLALKDGGQEALKIDARFLEMGREAIIDEIAEGVAGEKFPQYMDELRDDPEWKERLDILDRTDEANAAEPLTDEERAFLVKTQEEYIAELTRRQQEEVEYQRRTLARLKDEEIKAKYLETWLEQRGTSLATGEYMLTELWFGSRVCDATPTEVGVWDHAKCNGHPDRVFDSKAEVRSLPEGLQTLLRDAVARLTMSPRDAKNSDRQGSSSDSFPLPSEPAESTPSTPDETPATAPGTSPQP